MVRKTADENKLAISYYSNTDAVEDDLGAEAVDAEDVDAEDVDTRPASSGGEAAGAAVQVRAGAERAGTRLDVFVTGTLADATRAAAHTPPAAPTPPV